MKAATEEVSTGLTPIPRDRIDPRLLAHLEPGEQVLWQGQPRQGSFFGPGVAATGVGLVMAGILLAFGLGGHVLTSDLRRLWAILGVLAGLIVLARGWSRRAGLWSYAVTDRRLLSVLGRRLIRSVTPSQLDRMGLKIHGNTVYRAKTKQNTSTTFNDTRMSGPDGRFIGFHGQDDPEAIKTMIEPWRLAMSERAAGEAKSFVRAMPTPVRPEEEIAPEAQSLPEGVRRIVHPPTGLTIDVPSTWEVLVSNHTEGPLKLFGVTLLPSFIRETKAIPYVPGAEWNRPSKIALPVAARSVSCGLPQSVKLSMTFAESSCEDWLSPSFAVTNHVCSSPCQLAVMVPHVSARAAPAPSTKAANTLMLRFIVISLFRVLSSSRPAVSQPEGVQAPAGSGFGVLLPNPAQPAACSPSFRNLPETPSSRASHSGSGVCPSVTLKKVWSRQAMAKGSIRDALTAQANSRAKTIPPADHAPGMR
jgi:hypothetical protein